MNFTNFSSLIFVSQKCPSTPNSHTTYVNVGIYDVEEQRGINVVCFNVDLNKVRQRRFS